MRFQKVLVTGAGGLLGSAIVAELQGRTGLAGLDILPDPEGVAHVQGSVEDPAAVARAMKGCDAVLHIAARPNIWSGNGREIMTTNVVGTWNVLEAAEAAGVRRVVVTSSDSVVGYTVREGRMVPPDYLPVDIAHPLRPTDPYALSKQMCEAAARAFEARGLEMVVIRPVFVLYPDIEGEVQARSRHPDTYKWPMAGGRNPPGGGVMWHYVDPRDLARAFRLALDVDKAPFGPHFISGPNTLAPEPTIDRLARIMGRRIEVRRPEVYARNPFAPLYDLDGARDALGYVPEHDLRAKLAV